MGVLPAERTRRPQALRNMISQVRNTTTYIRKWIGLP